MGSMRAVESVESSGWTTAGRQTRVWVVRDRDEENGEPRPADRGRLGPAGGESVEPAKVNGSGGAPMPDLAPPTAPSDEEDDEDDARELRMDRVAVLYGEITAATRAFLAAVAECDRHRDWEHAGFGSCAEWLAWRIGVTRNTANEKVRVALALEELPLTSEAMARGELSFSKVRALTRQATPANETELLELARAGSAANLERVLRGWTNLGGADEARRERALHRSRRFSVFPDPESQGGMYVVKGRLTPEVAAALMRAVEAASDALFKQDQSARSDRMGGNGAGDAGRDEHAPDPAQLRADAIGLVAERALAAGFQGADAPVSGSRAERYQVMLHVEAEALEQGGNGRRSNGRRKNGLQPPLSELKDGTRVTAETARRLSCDAARVVVRTNADGAITGAGRRTRTVPPATRRALEARDRGCRFPGCGVRFTDGHHIVHWADGGPTTLENLVLLCRRHHRRVHEGRYQVCSGADGTIVFFTPRGRALYEAPPAPELPDHPVEELVQGNRDRGVVPDGWAAAPRWHRDGDIPWPVEAAAREALDPWDDEARCDDEAPPDGQDHEEGEDAEGDQGGEAGEDASAEPEPARLPRKPAGSTGSLRRTGATTLPQPPGPAIRSPVER